MDLPLCVCICMWMYMYVHAHILVNVHLLIAIDSIHSYTGLTLIGKIVLYNII